MKQSFSLSEILVTILVIVTIFAMTIPNLISKQREQSTTAKLKKVYSTLSNAFTLAVQENGDPTNWNLGTYASPDSAAILINVFEPYLNITKNCGKKAGCYEYGKYKQLSNADWTFLGLTHYSSAQLSDGTVIMSYIYSSTCSWTFGSTNSPLYNTCGSIDVDINGMQKPNQYGIDTFSFFVTKTGLYPAGIQKSTNFTFDSYCKDKAYVGISGPNGIACTAWVIYNENMDYLNCQNLGWGVREKCN